MNNCESPVIDERLYLPCQYANKKMNGHWYVFPSILAAKYDELRKKKKALNVN